MQFLEKRDSFPIISLVAVLLLLFLFCCSPVSYSTDQTVPYCEVVGTVWYNHDYQGNNLEEYIFYNDSIIIWEYFYSPYEQVDNKTGKVYPKYRVMSILKRKMEIFDKNIPYKDNDNELIYMHYYRGYVVAENGARPYDYSFYNYIFICNITPNELWMGMYDEFKEVQEYWTFYSEPPIQLDFTGWR